MNELLWYTSRATGVASIVLLTVVLCLGLVTAGHRTSRVLTTTVVTGLHRTLGLGVSVFLLGHIATAVAETYVSIDLVSVVLPFTSGYERAWVGLGTLAVDLVAAVVVTSLLRHRLPERVWRGVHVMAYALWPLAVVHGLALGTADEPLLRGTTVLCAFTGAAALAWRLTHHSADEQRRLSITRQEWA